MLTNAHTAEVCVCNPCIASASDCVNLFSSCFLFYFIFLSRKVVKLGIVILHWQN